MHRRYFSRTVFGFILLAMLAGCNRDQEEVVTTEPGAKEFPSQEGWNSELYLSKAGHLLAMVRYGHMMKYDEKKIVYFDQSVEVDFYDGEGNHTSHLTSERGEYHEATEDVLGLGNVVVVSDSGVTLRTEVLKWDNRREKILSDTVVMVTTMEHDTLYGVGFESDPNLNRWVIHRPWGVSEKRIDIEKLESSFSKTSSQDTVADESASDRKKE